MKTRWEYLIARQQFDEERNNFVTILLTSKSSRITIEPFWELVDELGEDGWELVSAIACGIQVIEIVNEVSTTTNDYIFKRPKA